MPIFGALLASLAVAAAFSGKIGGETAVGPSRPYLILAEEPVRRWLERLLGSPALRARPAEASSMSLALCLDAWRGDSAEGVACVQSRIPIGAGEGLVLIHGLPSPSPTDLLISCIGPVGQLDLRLGPGVSGPDWAGLDTCLGLAVPKRPGPEAALYGLRTSALFPTTNGERMVSGARAASVLSIAVDHVGHPRGLRGQCLVVGRVKAVRRGPAQSPRGRVKLTIPCAAAGPLADDRRIPMGELVQGSFADIYLDDRQQLIDYRRERR